MSKLPPQENNPFKNAPPSTTTTDTTDSITSRLGTLKISKIKPPTIKLFEENKNPFADPYKKRQQDSTSNEIKPKLPEISAIPKRKAQLLEVSKEFLPNKNDNQLIDPLTSDNTTYYKLFGEKNSTCFFVPIKEEGVKLAGEPTDHID